MIEPTRDWDLVKRIVTDKTIYPKVSDDKSPCADCWQPVKDSRVHYLLAKQEIDVLGLFAVAPENGTCYSFHVCLYPHSYGAKATAAGKELILWVFKNLDCLRLTGQVPDFNRFAMKYAERIGLTKFGYNPKSYLKDGKLYGLNLYGISREEVWL